MLPIGSLVGTLNTDIWNMCINWENNIRQGNYTRGMSYTFVVQPWLNAGYYFHLNHAPVRFGMSTGFGREINIITSGKHVGQGWMNSLILHANYDL